MMRLDHLPNQHKDERVVLFLRRHWFAPARIVVVFCILIAIPVFGYVVLDNLVASWMSSPLLGPIVSLLLILYVLAVWLFSFMEFTDYYLDTWIVTTQRIINIEQKGLFSRVASELPMDAVQDVTSNIQGIARTIFDYGDVIIQTAGELKHFHFKEIGNPEKVKEQIIHLVEKDRERLEVIGTVQSQKPRKKIQ